MSGRRPILFAVAGLFVAFAAYGSFVPLRWNAVPLDAAVAKFAQTPFIPMSRVSRGDFLTNVLLFAPIGFFLLGAAANRSRALAAVWFVPVVLFGFALSVAIEFGQIFVSGRTPSWNDVFAETLGGALGALSWAALGTVVVDWLAVLLHSDSQSDRHSDSQSDRAFRLLGAYTALWVVLGLQPFDYTLRPAELAQKLRAGRIVLQPFGGRDTLSDVGGTLLMAVPVGAFGVLAAVHRRSARPALLGLTIATGATCLVEFSQLLAMSRTADVTDLLMNGAGGSAGVFLATRALTAPLRPGSASGVRLWPLGALGVWCIVLVVRHWTPFDFVADAGFVRSRVPLLFRVPFHSYYWANPLSAFAEASSKFLLGMPVGALLQWMWWPSSSRLRFVQALGILAMSTALFLG
jgi:glycopeptide antibiotics resistance protein